MTWLWLLVLLVLFFLLLDRFIERMYAYPIQPHRKTPASFGIAFEEVRIPTENEGTLYGWWVPGKPQAPAIILLHGWSRNVERVLRYIQHLHPQGYNLLAFDARNHGSSSPEPHPTVMTFTEDLCAAVRYLQTEKGVSRIGVIGLSVGGGAALNAAGLCPQDIHSVITVGAIAHPVATMQEEMTRRGIPQFVIRALIRWMEWRYRLNFDAIAPERNVRQAQARILLVHGDQDQTVSLDQARRLLSAAPPGQAELWVVPGRGHSDCSTHPEFWERISAFLQANLPCSPEKGPDI